MTLATLNGRLQTKLLTYVVLAGITLPFWMMGGEAYLELFMLAMLAGLILETIWGCFICHQPGWLTFLFGAIEFGVITATALALHLNATVAGAAAYYLTAWVIIQLFLIYLMPVVRSDWIDNGREVW